MNTNANTSDTSLVDESDTGAAVAAIEQVAQQRLDDARDEAIAELKTPSALDRSLQRRPDARQRHGAPRLRDADPLTIPSPSLDAGVIAALPGYSDDTRSAVGIAETALSTAQEVVKAIIEARIASERNPMWNEANQIVAVADLAGKQQDRATRAIDSATAALRKAISDTESTLRAPVQSGGSLGAEIAGYVRGLEEGKRLAFLICAARDGDTTTMSAVLSRPAYLVGLTPEQQTALTEAYHRARNPQSAARLELMRAALDKLDAAGPLLLTQVERAMGAKWSVAQRLRGAQAAALKAFGTKAA